MSNNDGSPNGKRTLIDEGSEFRGSLTSSCPILVLGKIEGEVNGPAVEVAGGGTLSGQIKVAELRCLGELAGQVQAETVQLAGRVLDRTVISARFLEVVSQPEAAPVQFGECELSVGEAPEKQAAIDEATGKVRPEPVTALVPATPAAQAAPSAPEAPIPTERSKRLRANGSARPADGPAEKTAP